MLICFILKLWNESKRFLTNLETLRQPCSPVIYFFGTKNIKALKIFGSRTCCTKKLLSSNRTPLGYFSGTNLFE